MNRVQRRKEFRLNGEELAQLIQSTEKQSSKKCTEWLLIFMAHALYDEYNFGTQRINNVIKTIVKFADTVLDGTVEGDQMIKWCEYMGIKYK